MTILIFIVILSILVLVHELGHFLVAKFFRVKVEEFGIGFPPRVYGKKIGETLYSINLLPIGGFVKLYGEDEAGGGKLKSQKSEVRSQKVDLERAFIGRPVWQRFLIVVAGVVMNFLLAVVLISYLFGVSGVPVPGDKVLITDIAKGSPAEKVGLSAQDVIREINGKKITSPAELSLITRQNIEKEMTIIVETPKGEIKKILVTPRKSYPEGQGPIGIAIGQNIVVKKYPWYQAPIAGTAEALKMSAAIVQGLGALVVEVAVERDVPKGIAGPVGIAQLTGEFARHGPQAVLTLVSLLSLNLAILNILPIPALDGGRLFFIGIEGITRRKVSPKVESYIHMVGMAVLLALIAFITFHDLTRIFNGQSLLPKP